MTSHSIPHTAPVAAAVALILLAPLAAGEDSPVESLISTERAFAKTSVEKGMKEAFLAYLAPEAVVFRPGPVNGHEWIKARPDPGIRLEWEPAVADVSSAGDLGYTTGPWTVTAVAEGKETHAYGQFVSVWKKQEDGAWRVVLDHGITHPSPGDPVKKVAIPEPAAAAKTSDEAAGTLSLQEAERKLDTAGQDEGITAAYGSLFSDDVRLYREGGAPILGAMAAHRWIASHPGHVDHNPEGTRVARSGDLGYAWGTLSFRPSGAGAAQSGSYVRIWRKGASGAWSIVLDVVTPNG